MSQPTRSLTFVYRSCCSKLGVGSSGRRAFSSAARNQKPVPSFQPSDSPRLDAIFAELREKVFVPAALSQSHRRLVFRPTRQSILTNEPGVTTTIGDDEEIKLNPLDPQKRPSLTRACKDILKLLPESNDDPSWENVFALLEGLRDSRQGLPYPQKERLVKAAFAAGRSRDMVNIIEQAKKTGFYAQSVPIAQNFMYCCHRRAQKAGYKGEEFEAAAKEARLVARLMDRDEIHVSSPPNKERAFDNRQALQTVGVLLEMAAAEAINKHDGKDIDGQVSDYLAKALVLSKVGIADGTSLYIDRSKRKNADSHLQWVEKPALEILLNAMEMAGRVEGVPSANQQKAYKERLSTLTDRIEVVKTKIDATLKARFAKRGLKEDSSE